MNSRTRNGIQNSIEPYLGTDDIFLTAGPHLSVERERSKLVPLRRYAEWYGRLLGLNKLVQIRVELGFVFEAFRRAVITAGPAPVLEDAGGVHGYHGVVCRIILKKVNASSYYDGENMIWRRQLLYWNGWYIRLSKTANICDLQDILCKKLTTTCEVRKFTLKKINGSDIYVTQLL